MSDNNRPIRLLGARGVRGRYKLVGTTPDVYVGMNHIPKLLKEIKEMGYTRAKVQIWIDYKSKYAEFGGA